MAIWVTWRAEIFPFCLCTTALEYNTSRCNCSRMSDRQRRLLDESTDSWPNSIEFCILMGPTSVQCSVESSHWYHGRTVTILRRLEECRRGEEQSNLDPSAQATRRDELNFAAVVVVIIIIIMRNAYAKLSQNAIVDVRRRESPSGNYYFLNISETTRTSNFKIYHKLYLDSLYISTANNIIIIFMLRSRFRDKGSTDYEHV